jgi:hypothetical protein
MPKNPVDKKPDLESKPGKYFLAKKKGMTKKDAAISAGYADFAHTSIIEKTKTYQAIERHFKDELLDVISLGTIAKELVKNIKQDKDRGAKNKAIEISLSRIEPDKALTENDDKVLVILR